VTEASPIVDAHHHFWDPAEAAYPWLTDELAAIRRRFGPEDLEPLLEATGVEQTILVQTRSSVAETDAFLATAARTPFIAGVVGWVDLLDPGVADALAQLRGGTGGEKLLGIRHQVHDEPDPDWLRRSDARRGIGAVGPLVSPTTSSSGRASCRPRSTQRGRCRTSASSSTTSPSPRSATENSSPGRT